MLRKKFKPYRYQKKVVYRRSAKKSRGSDFVVSLIGYGFILSSLVGILLLASPWLVAQSLVVLRNIESHQMASANETPSVLGASLPAPTPTPEVDFADLPFNIRIPKLNLNSKITSNVDAGNESEYRAALKIGVAHAFGSAFPGQGQMVFIFGHSTDFLWNVETYNALFYQIKDLVLGDEIILQLGDEVYVYEVSEKHIVAPDDLSLLEEKKDEDVLILQTCYPPGTTWQRLLVVAERVETVSGNE